MKLESGQEVGEAVEQSLGILELLADAGVVHTPGTLARRLGIGRRRMMGLLGMLRRQGLVEVSGSGACALGLAAAGLAGRLLDSVGIIGRARPVLEDLARKHGELVYLSVLKDDDVIYLDVAGQGKGEEAWALLGKRFPSLLTSAGKVCRAQQSRDLLEKVLRGPIRSRRPEDLEERLVELDKIRARGIAVDVCEESCSVATAVRDYTGKVVCALTVRGPSVRMLNGRIEEEIAPSLIQGAASLSQKLGYAR